MVVIPLIAAIVSIAVPAVPTGRRVWLRLSKIQATVVIYIPSSSKMGFKDRQEDIRDLEFLASVFDPRIVFPLLGNG